MTVSLGCISLFAFLYGSLILFTDSTTSKAPNHSASTSVVSPINPIKEAFAPSDKWSPKPISFSCCFKLSTLFSSAPFFNTKIIVFSSSEIKSRCLLYANTGASSLTKMIATLNVYYSRKHPHHKNSLGKKNNTFYLYSFLSASLSQFLFFLKIIFII